LNLEEQSRIFYHRRGHVQVFDARTYHAHNIIK